MLETLTRGFRSAKQRLSGVAELTDDVIDEALRDVRMSLLEADVEFNVTKSFLERVREKARGEDCNGGGTNQRVTHSDSPVAA